MTARLAPLPPPVQAVGGQLFARYAYPPNARGYCGPEDAEEVLAYASGALGPDGGLVARAREFLGAWPYLELIAAANGGVDPLDIRVVRGYWLGERAVDAVAATGLREHLSTAVRPRLGRSWPDFLRHLGDAAVPDHAFHVLCVYPWMGLLRGGRAEPARSVIESCCIRPGRVVTVDGERAGVLTPAFAWDGSRLTLAAPELRLVRWRREGLGPVADLAAGDGVTVHWDWICERVDESRLRRLASALRRRLALSRW